MHDGMDEITDKRRHLQAEHMQVWLQYAPKPPERGNNAYDAFIIAYVT